MDFESISLEKTLNDQRIKLTALGPHAHEILTRHIPVSDEVLLVLARSLQL